MTNEEKLRIIEDSMELAEGTVKEDDLLEKYSEWDSLAALTFVALVQKKLKKAISEKDLRATRTIRDVMNLM